MAKLEHDIFRNGVLLHRRSHLIQVNHQITTSPILIVAETLDAARANSLFLAQRAPLPAGRAWAEGRALLPVAPSPPRGTAS